MNLYKITLDGGYIEVHESARTLPETRRVEMECYQLVDSGIGSTIEDFDRHFDTLNALIAGESYEELGVAVQNMRYLFFDLLNKQLSPRALSFACLVETVNGEKWEDYSEKGLERLVVKLSDMGLSDYRLRLMADDLKKKVYSELITAFPTHFGDVGDRSLDLLRDCLLLDLDSVLTPDDVSILARRRQIYQTIARNAKPPIVEEGNPANVLDAIRKAHRQRKVLMMTEHLPVTDLTPAFTFWEYVVTLEERYEANKPK